MFWAEPELSILARHYETVGDENALFEIKAALKFVEQEYEKAISTLPSLVPHFITFEYFWALLPPDCLVVGKNMLDFDNIWRVRSHQVQQEDDGVFLVMTAERILWDGTKVGNVQSVLRTPAFGGLKPIKDLPFIPIKYHPNREEIIERILHRSAKTLKFWQSGFKLQEHQGAGIAEVHDKVERYAVSNN